MDESVEAVDLITLVQRDHREIEGLLDQVERADDGARTTLFSDVVQKLEAHEAAEADIVHALMRDLGAPDIADDLVEEEKLAKHVLSRLDPSSPDFTRQFKAFKEDVLTPRDTRSARSTRAFALAPHTMSWYGWENGSKPPQMGGLRLPIEVRDFHDFVERSMEWPLTNQRRSTTGAQRMASASARHRARRR